MQPLGAEAEYDPNFSSVRMPEKTMEFTLTSHAKKRCVKRHIQIEWIRQALDNPVRTEDDLDDPNLAHAIYPVPERGFKVLRVVYNENRHPVTIVTAFFDSEKGAGR